MVVVGPTYSWRCSPRPQRVLGAGIEHCSGSRHRPYLVSHQRSCSALRPRRKQVRTASHSLGCAGQGRPASGSSGPEAFASPPGSERASQTIPPSSVLLHFETPGVSPSPPPWRISHRLLLLLRVGSGSWSCCRRRRLHCCSGLAWRRLRPAWPGAAIIEHLSIVATIDFGSHCPC